MEEESERVQPIRKMTLRRQVIIAMALALSPLLILGGLSALSERSDQREARYQELVDASREGMSSVNAALSASRLALRMVSVDDRQPPCADIGERMARLDLPVSNVYRFNIDGKVVCSSVGDNLIGQSMPDPEWIERLRKGAEELESTAFPGLALGEPVVWMIRGTYDAAGAYTGSLAFTLDLQQLSRRFPVVEGATGLNQALVTSSGAVIGSELISEVPANWLTTEAMLAQQVRKLQLPQGQRVELVITPVAVDGIRMMTPSATPPRQRLDTLALFLIPLLAYLAALFAATWILDIMVLRWLERLRLRISDMRRNDEMTPLAMDLAGASAELQQLARAFDDLTSRVASHEADSRHALNRMKGAFRETHHRVKNNLQVMLSMLKLQVRGEEKVETQHALRIAAQRVAMMAAVHHSLLNEAHLEYVEAEDLIDAICSQIHEQQGWGEESRHIARDVDKGPLPSDLAVPLAMFIQEAFDMLCPPSGSGTITEDLRLSLTRQDGNARLRLCCARTNPGSEEDASRERHANFFLAAFARQMEGSVEQLGDDPDNVVIELVFPVTVETGGPPA
jgi:two-component sensor histidine kinase